ncbi:MAG: hypothetical protein WC241_03815 [Candidatus Paceibacterota bacterium]|jgi:hypothetical protein
MQKQTCQKCKKGFEILDEDKDFYSRINVPIPTFCSECRLIRRMCFRNERTLYKRTCDAKGHGEPMITVFSPDKKQKVYCHSAWWGDSWDAMEYGRDYDNSLTFFSQLQSLWQEVPDIGLFNTNPVNSEYCSITEGNKNCYLVIGGDFNEETMYSSFIFHSKECADCYSISKSEWNYQVIDSIQNYNLLYSQYCEGCYDSFFLFNCKNCSNCFGCVNLNNGSYVWRNEQLTKEEYKKKLNEVNLGSYTSIIKFKKDLHEFSLKFPRKYARILRSINSTGDNMEQAKNCKGCFAIFEGAEDSKYLWQIYSKIVNSFDSDHSGLKSELLYDCSTVYPGHRILFSRFIFSGQNIEYSYNCHNSSNLFGCVGLRNKHYCILNKQYEKIEYEKLVKEIKKHMDEMPYINKVGNIYKYGEFFPEDISPFAYNETVANELNPLDEETARKTGYIWKQKEEKNYTITKKPSELPDNIKEVTGAITKEIIQCEHNGNCNDECSTAFKITEEELRFYRKMNIPLPRLCSNCRHYERLQNRNPLKLWHRKCMKEGCENEFETTYSPDKIEIIYCEKCYQQEVY